MIFIKLLLLLPVLASFVARAFLSDRIILKKGEGDVSITGGEMVARILKKGRASDVKIQVKSRPFMVLGPQRLVISPTLSKSKRARDVAEAGLLAGLVLMAQRQSKVVSWRLWAVKFGSAMPIFTAIAMAFAIVMGRSAVLCLVIVAATLGLATLFLWLTLAVERAAAATVSDMLEETPLVSRRSEGGRLAKLVRAFGWRRIVPGAIGWIGQKK